MVEHFQGCIGSKLFIPQDQIVLHLLLNFLSSFGSNFLFVLQPLHLFHIDIILQSLEELIIVNYRILRQRLKKFSLLEALVEGIDQHIGCCKGTSNVAQVKHQIYSYNDSCFLLLWAKQVEGGLLILLVTKELVQEGKVEVFKGMNGFEPLLCQPNQSNQEYQTIYSISILVESGVLEPTQVVF